MALYFFDITDDGTTEHEDVDGHDCTNDAAARELALRTLTAIAADRVPRGSNEHDLSIVVHDGRGQAVYQATLRCLGQLLRG